MYIEKISLFTQILVRGLFTPIYLGWYYIYLHLFLDERIINNMHKGRKNNTKIYKGSKVG
jgi:hypothetical protein